MKLGITLNETIRDFIGHMTYVVPKIRNITQESLGLNENNITDLDLPKWFGFSSKEELNLLLYSEASLEFFGHPDQLHDNIVNKLNRFYNDLKEDGDDVDVIIINREVGRAVPSTLFFLSKTSCEIPNIVFVNEYDKIWDHVDVLVTADPVLLVSKPDDKKTIKINASYNKNCDGDRNLDSITELFENTSILNELV